MTEKALNEVQNFMNNPKFQNTWVIAQTIADMIEKHNVIPLDLLVELNRRVDIRKKQGYIINNNYIKI
jgi:hypothetical protein